MILFSHKCGQLGNRLFAFAHLIANAEANKIKLVNLSFDEYAQYFETTSQDVFCRYPIRSTIVKSNRIRSMLFTINRATLKALRMSSFVRSRLHEVVVADLPEYQFNEGKYFDLNSLLFQKMIGRKPFVFLFGRFFRDYHNVEKYQDVIRKFFRPTPTIQQNVNDFLSKVRRDTDLVVGVHIRRGDYQQFAGGKYFYTLQEYCRKMIELQSAEHDKKITFVICSNETIDPALFSGLNFFIGPEHLIEAMYTFAGCDLLMGPPSTYSRWASFYGRTPLYQLNRLDMMINIQKFVMLPNEQLLDF